MVQAEHLEPSTIGQDRSIPAHEPMQPAEAGDTIGAGPQGEVVGVPQQHLRAEPTQLVRAQRLYGRLRSHRHERRGIDRAMGCAQASSPRATLFREQLEAHGITRPMRAFEASGWGLVINMQSPKL